ncbi:hypothetical protein DITRI_Ditri19aG0198900 [Diplodiscus trichospermus]
MAFSNNLLHLLIIVSPFLLCSASRQLPKLKEPSTMQFETGSTSPLLPQPSFPGDSQSQTPVGSDSLLPDFPIFQDPMLPPPPPSIAPKFTPNFPFPGLPSLPKFPPFPFIPTMPFSSPITATPPTIAIPSEVHHNP